MEAVLNVISSIFTTIFPFFFKKPELSQFEKNIEQLRFDVSTALTMYACYFHNPVDLAKQPNQQLPSNYENASNDLRKLASTARALAETYPSKIRKNAISKDALNSVSANLIGLSNSMTTPYNCSISRDDFNHIGERETQIRQLLCIAKL